MTGDAPGLQTKVPTTAVTGRGVPLELLPFSTRPSTSKKAAPVLKLTRARPLGTDQGPAPARIPLTGLSTPGTVITPTILFQRADSPRSKAMTDPAQNSNESNAAATFFISYSFILNAKNDHQGRTGYASKVEENKTR